MSKMPHENGLSMLAEASVQAVPEPQPALVGGLASADDDDNDVVLPEPEFPFQCPACTKQYESIPGWMVHFKKYHPDLKMPRFKHTPKRKPKNEEIYDQSEEVSPDGTVTEVIAEGLVSTSSRGRKKRSKKEDDPDVDEYDYKPSRRSQPGGVGRGRGRKPNADFELPTPPPVPGGATEIARAADVSTILQHMDVPPDVVPPTMDIDPTMVAKIAAEAAAEASAAQLEAETAETEGEVGPRRRGRKKSTDGPQPEGGEKKRRKPRRQTYYDTETSEEELLAAEAPRRHWKKRATQDAQAQETNDPVTLTLPNINVDRDGEGRLDEMDYAQYQQDRAAAAAARDNLTKGRSTTGRPRRDRKPKGSTEYEYLLDEAGRPIRPEGAEAESDEGRTASAVRREGALEDEEYEYSEPEEARPDEDLEYNPYEDPDEEKRNKGKNGEPKKTPFKCPHDGCNAAFVWADHLQRHMVTHTGDKPFKCNVCGTAFTRRDHLTRHHGRFHAGRTLLSAEVGGRQLRQRPKEENRDFIVDYASEDLEDHSSEESTDEEAEAEAMQELEAEAKAHFPVPNYIECEQCGQWRKLSTALEKQVADGVIKFVCALNDDPAYASCEVPQALTNQEIDDEIAVVLSQQQAYARQARRRAARVSRVRRKRRAAAEKAEQGEQQQQQQQQQQQPQKKRRGRQRKIKPEEPPAATEKTAEAEPEEEEEEETQVSEWSCCDTCGKWRRLPPGTSVTSEKWYCNMNPDPEHNRCEVPEESFDDEQEAELGGTEAAAAEEQEQPLEKPPKKKPGRKPKPKPAPEENAAEAS